MVKKHSSVQKNKSSPQGAVISAVTPEAILKAVDDQRMKLLNVLGGLQCMKVAVRCGPDEVRQRVRLPICT